MYPFDIYLIYYRVLCKSGDVRAPALLAEAAALLQDQAARIDDATLHRSFLDNIPSHRELACGW